MIDDLYREELRTLHEGGRAFARGHPDAARWLGEPGADPDVERLLEGVAYLCARLRLRAEAVDDELAQALCAALLPGALRPLPALAVLRFSGQRELRERERVPAGTAVDSVVVDGDPCRFRLAWDVAVPPCRITAIELHPGDWPRLEVHLALPEGVVPQRLGSELRLHAAGGAPLARALVRALATPRRLHAATAAGRVVPLTAAWHGPGAAPPTLPDASGQARGHGILAEALAWPELSRFVTIAGPEGFGVQAGERGLRLVAELPGLPGELRGAGPDDLLLGCAPAINLFPAEAEPLLVDGRWRDRALVLAGHPGGEPWAVQRVRGSAAGRAVRAWAEASCAGGGPCWQELRGADGVLRLAVGALDEVAQREVLSVDVLAHDGVRCTRLGAGDIRVPSIAVPGTLDVANLAPPTRPLPAPSGPARIQALARRLRLAATGLRDLDDLRRLVDLHDRAAEAMRPPVAPALQALALRHAAVPLAASAARALVAELQVDEARLGGVAGAWLFGCALERAWSALAPLGTVTALEIACAVGDRLAWPARCAEGAA